MPEKVPDIILIYTQDKHVSAALKAMAVSTGKGVEYLKHRDQETNDPETSNHAHDHCFGGRSGRLSGGHAH